MVEPWISSCAFLRDYCGWEGDDRALQIFLALGEEGPYGGDWLVSRLFLINAIENGEAISPSIRVLVDELQCYDDMVALDEQGRLCVNKVKPILLKALAQKYQGKTVDK